MRVMASRKVAGVSVSAKPASSSHAGSGLSAESVNGGFGKDGAAGVAGSIVVAGVVTVRGTSRLTHQTLAAITATSPSPAITGGRMDFFLAGSVMASLPVGQQVV